MFDTLSIRLKIVLLSGLCLLGVIALIVSLNIYQTNQNDQTGQAGCAWSVMMAGRLCCPGPTFAPLWTTTPPCPIVTRRRRRCST